MNNSILRQKATSGLAWSAVERFSLQGVAFAVQIVLARVLEPAQFGLIAMVAVFVIMGEAVIEAGLGAALVQKKDLSDTDSSTVFYFNLLAAGFMVSLIWLCAPAVAVFYGQAELTSVLRALSLGLILGASGNIHESMLRRKLEFRKLFWVSTPASLLSGVAGIGMALTGYGVWALVGQTLARHVLVSLMLWIRSDWRPQLVFSRDSLSRLLPYGMRLAVAAVLDRGFRDIYVLIIGKLYSPLDVGYFQRATHLQRYPITNMQTVISRVTFPLFSSIQHQPDRLRAAMRKSVQMGTLAAFPGMAVMGALAHPLIHVLLGEKWLPSASMLQLLCISGGFYPMHALNLNVLKAIGRSDLFLRLELYKKAFTVLIILVTVKLGIHVMIIGIIIQSIISLVLNCHYTKKLIDYGLKEQIKDIAPMTVLAGFLWGTLLLVQQFIPSGPWLQLGGGITIALLVATLSLRCMTASVKTEIGILIRKFPYGKRMTAILLGEHSA